MLHIVSVQKWHKILQSAKLGVGPGTEGVPVVGVLRPLNQRKAIPHGSRRMLQFEEDCVIFCY